MSSGMFSVWVVLGIENPFGQSRSLVTFVDQETADEWWRAISENAEAAALVRRLTPQLYSYTRESWGDDSQTPNLLTARGRFANVTHRFLGKFVLEFRVQQADGTLDRAAFTLNPGPQQVTDRVSGNWFCIRSKIAPHFYWINDGSGCIKLSDKGRSRFQVAIHNPGPTVPEKAVMIPSDHITIRTSGGAYLGLQHAEGRKVLTVTETLQTAFRFSELAAGNFGCAGGCLQDGASLCFIEGAAPGAGEAWELVQ
ncbi:hypothetical protein CC1G_10151 [Coprinopsis cinerea okayama7|uniref:Uncharacterized protein n=1 Tax=Coprinopsis cinerea (strain Okayama-7 / 130 / ATCC MYA-4618 / FGSC 9003) TaxID=240176 RepID=A8PEE5_COPC7|nr:hypothetical protein CC1G_10151 [Coprinopsis cinerea okayama7\|eukprot:XP_001840777.1 hypothetical protein CC1G_10151 [Coprinopsis cinerea okayama7\